MRKIVFREHGPYCGTDDATLEEFPDGISDADLDQICLENLYEVAERWPPQEEGDFEDEEDDYQNHLDSCGSWWEEYDPEKHDGIL